jgi:hypothetical protein
MERTSEEFERNHSSIQTSYVVISRYKTLYKEEEGRQDDTWCVQISLNLGTSSIYG